MFWTVEKLEARWRELDSYRYRDAIPLSPLRWKKEEKSSIGSAIAAYPDEEGPWQSISIGDRWQGRDEYYWLAVDVQIPASWLGRKVLLRFDLGASGGGNNSGFESLLFLNGAAYQGVDRHHSEVFLPEQVIGSTIALRLRLWSGLGGYEPELVMEHELKRAELAWLDESADDLYFTARAVLETVKLKQQNAEQHALRRALDRAFLRMDWSRPGSDMFYISVKEARELLHSELDRMPHYKHPVNVQCIGHTHIDIAWLWRLCHTREKAARSFATVLRLMELYPDYIFLQTMPQLYTYIKHDYPEIYEQIKERVREGRWEAGGAMWLEADCNLSSGESLVRQLLYGIRFFQEEFGVECKYLWLPDVFGYSWALPQILKKSGIETFMTTKISWNQYNRMPHDTFMWRGIDGTEVLTHFITTPDSGGSEGSFYYTYNGAITPHSVQGIWNSYQNKELNDELLLAYGYGDGGGGVNREMLEMRRRLETMPGLPKVTTGRADEYFERLQKRIATTDQYVHTWDGELYLELHRGTYTSQAYNKRMNRKLELLLREAEWLSVWAAVHQGNWELYHRQSLNESWTIVLRNQFHDIIPGSSIREVYEDSREEYAQALQLAGQVYHDSACLLGCSELQQELSITIFNSASWNRVELLQIPSNAFNRAGAWTDEQGQPLLAQRSYQGDWIIQSPDVPAFGQSVIRFLAEAEAVVSPSDESSIFQWSPGTLITPHYELQWNDAGQWTRLYDRAGSRDVLAVGELGNVFQVFEDKPKSRHEAWDIDIYYQEKMKQISQLRSAELLECGPLRAVVRFSWTFMDSTIEQDLIVYAGSRRLELDTRVDWHEQRNLLKVAFPVAIRSVEATYDIQFGNVKRPTHWNTSWDQARFETVGHFWADLSERSYGVSLLNDCKYGYDIKDNQMRLTLIKAAKVPDASADLGYHEFKYALLPHEGDWVEGGTDREAWSLNSPLGWFHGAAAVAPAPLFQLVGPHVKVAAVKKAEDFDAWILRIYEYTGARSPVTIRFTANNVSWQECDLMERPSSTLSSASEIMLELQPYEIKTFLVR